MVEFEGMEAILFKNVSPCSYEGYLARLRHYSSFDPSFARVEVIQLRYSLFRDADLFDWTEDEKAAMIGELNYFDKLRRK